MKKLILLPLLFLLHTGTLFCQSGTTAVTAVVRDANGTLFVNCQYSVVFVGQNTTPGAGPYAPAALLNGQQGNCDSFAALNLNLADNINTVSPTPSQWAFSICSAPGYIPGGTYCKANILITITGTTQDITAQLSLQLPLLPIPGGGGCVGCSNGVIPQFNGFNLVNSVPQIDNNLTNANALTVADPNGLVLPGDGTHAGSIQLNGNTANPTIFPNTAGYIGPSIASFSKYACQFPSTAPSGQVLQCGAPDGNGISIGSWVSAGGGGGGNVFTNPVGAQAIIQPVSSSATTVFSANNFANYRYVTPDWNWLQTDVAGSIGNLASAGSGKTLTLTPCPIGVDVANNVQAPYYVEVAGTGTAEAALVTGGTCATGGTTGSIVVTTVNNHAAGFTVGSSTSGIQEAINDAQAVSNTKQGVQVYLQPQVTNGIANYTANSTIYLKSGKAMLWGYGALLLCNTRFACMVAGNQNGSTGTAATIMGLEFQAGLNIDGVQISSVVAASGTYTITTATAHPFVTGDFVTQYFSTPSQTQEAIVQVTVTGANTYTYVLGSSTFSSASGYGWANISNIGIYDLVQDVTLRDIKFRTGLSNGRFSWAIANSNDQKMNIDSPTTEGSGGVIKCTSNFCGAFYYGRGDSGAAGIAYIHNADISLQCGGNGIRNVSGNTISIRDSVVQGFAQYGIYYSTGTGLNAWEADNVYEEVGSCTNPFYPGTLAAEAGFISNGPKLTITGNAPAGGSFPSFLAANVGATQNNYFVVPTSSINGVGPMMFIGSALTTGSGNVTTYWPSIDLNGQGTVTYDVLRTVGSTAVPPYSTVATSIATGNSGSCTTAGICTFVDPQSGTSPYTVPQQTGLAPVFSFWPASVALGAGGSLYIDTCPQVSTIVPTKYTPTVFAKQAIAQGGSIGASNPAWCIALTGDAGGNNNLTVGATLQQAGLASAAATGGLKGFTNFLNTGSYNSTDIITLADSFNRKTLATPGGRPTEDANDTAIGLDTSSTGVSAAAVGVYMRAPISISGYIATVQDNSSWIFRGTATNFFTKVPSGTTPVAFSTLPACAGGTEGLRRAITDANTLVLGATVAAGGGSNHVEVYCNGTSWFVTSTSAPSVSAVIVAVCGGTVGTSNGTAYVFFPSNQSTTTCAATASGTGNVQDLPMTGTGIAKNLFCVSNGGGIAADAMTLFKNSTGTNGATTLTAVVGTGTSANDTTHTVSFSAGDIWSIRYVVGPTGTETGGGFRCQFEFVRTQ